MLEALRQEYNSTVLEAQGQATRGEWENFDATVNHLHWITDTTVNLLASDIISTPEDDELDQ